jgi:mono/diheme cytochrome c family protein
MTNIVTVVLLLVLSVPAWAGDAERGKKLHDSQCIRCHDTKMYQRQRRVTQDWKNLRSVVGHWQSQLKLKWTETDIDDVATYLNQQFYHFQVPALVCAGGDACNANLNQSSSRVD